MSASLDSLANWPWPRGLSLEQAAAYVGVSPNTFQAEVRAGYWPSPERRGRRVIWDRGAIDQCWDARKKQSIAKVNITERAARWGGRLA